MVFWQNLLLVIVSFFSFVGFCIGFSESRKGNAYGFSYFYFLLGAFVWGDTIIFGLFWFIMSLVLLSMKSWVLTQLTFSVFWVVRSLGETIYWFLQQFSSINRNPPHKLFLYHIFKNDAIWFVIQIFWQCITVVSILSSLYFAAVWIRLLNQ